MTARENEISGTLERFLASTRLPQNPTHSHAGFSDRPACFCITACSGGQKQQRAMDACQRYLDAME